MTDTSDMTTPTNLADDMSVRWCPSVEQIDGATALLCATQADAVYTVQILVGKDFGFWTADVRVDTPTGFFVDGTDREGMMAASDYARTITDYYHARGIKATASYCRHYLRDSGEPWWAVFEDIMTDAGNPGSGR